MSKWSSISGNPIVNRVFQTIGQKLAQSMSVQNLSQRITARLWLSYSIPLLCLVALGGVTYSVARETVKIEAERAKLQSAEYDYSEASYHLSDAMRRVNAYALRPTVSSYSNLYGESYEAYLEHLSALTAMAESQQDDVLIALLETFEKETHRLNITAERMIEQIESGNPQSALALVSSLESVPVEVPRNALHDHLIERLEENAARFDTAQKRLFRTLIGGTALAFLTTVVLGFVTMRQLRYQMRKMVGVVEQSGIQVTTSSTQIAASSRQLEASVTEQAASATEISATAKEISATADSLSKTMVEVMALSDAAGVTASDGKQSLSRMAVTIHQLTAATATISSKLGQIV
ncbi:MAG: methyl-accepting chemotaxis protein, partial [Cyanobacteria bacterium J06649_4]